MQPPRDNAPPLIAALAYVPDGVPGVMATLKIMRKYVHAAKLNPALRHFFLQLVAGVPEKNWSAEARAVYSWVRANIRYVRDIRSEERRVG